jgi:hypothetical protein
MKATVTNYQRQKARAKTIKRAIEKRILNGETTQNSKKLAELKDSIYASHFVEMYHSN